MYIHLRPREDAMLNSLSTPRLVGAVPPRLEETISTPRQYLNYKILLSMITRDLGRGDCSVSAMKTFPLLPTLCHGNLSMAHVIVLNSAVVGVVGWTKCDFIPEVVDRMSSHLSRPCAEGESAWYRHLSNRLLFHPPPPPWYTVRQISLES